MFEGRALRLQQVSAAERPIHSDRVTIGAASKLRWSDLGRHSRVITSRPVAAFVEILEYRITDVTLHRRDARLAGDLA